MLETSPTILFVDDEDLVLDGLRRQLADMGDRWRLLFASSGSAALDLLESAPVDLVVSDMRMPGMDGASLLSEVARSHPTVSRFILSGHSVREVVFGWNAQAHQYLSKPCDRDRLVAALTRCLAIRGRIHAPDLLALISASKGVPALPHNLSKFFQQLGTQDCSITDLAATVLSDIGLTAQVLRLVNATDILVPGEVSDVLQAIEALGCDRIRSLGVETGAFEAFNWSGVDMGAVRRLSAEGATIATLAADIARYEGLDPQLVEQCRCAGMLAHVGSLLLLANWPGEMYCLQQTADLTELGRITLENRHFEATHGQIGGSLLSLWGFNETVVEAVLHHHWPSDALDLQSTAPGPLAIVHFAQYAVEQGMSRLKAPQGLDVAYLTGCGARLDAWAGLIPAGVLLSGRGDGSLVH